MYDKSLRCKDVEAAKSHNPVAARCSRLHATPSLLFCFTVLLDYAEVLLNRRGDEVWRRWEHLAAVGRSRWGREWRHTIHNTMSNKNIQHFHQSHSYQCVSDHRIARPMTQTWTISSRCLVSWATMNSRSLLLLSAHDSRISRPTHCSFNLSTTAFFLDLTLPLVIW
jgi:hypothetical protein